MVLLRSPQPCSSWVVWFMAPMALILALWLPLGAWSEGARGLRLSMAIMWALFVVCLALCVSNPQRFRWAGTLIAALLLIMVGTYDVRLLTFWWFDALHLESRDYAALFFMHAVCGYPSFLHLHHAWQRGWR